MMAYIMAKFHDFSHPKTKSKKLTQNRSIKTGKFGQSGRTVCEKKLHFSRQNKKIYDMNFSSALLSRNIYWSNDVADRVSYFIQ